MRFAVPAILAMATGASAFGAYFERSICSEVGASVKSPSLEEEFST